MWKGREGKSVKKGREGGRDVEKRLQQVRKMSDVEREGGSNF
jgi:hypothetical protein